MHVSLYIQTLSFRHRHVPSRQVPQHLARDYFGRNMKHIKTRPASIISLLGSCGKNVVSWLVAIATYSYMFASLCHIFQLLWKPCNGWKVHCGKNSWQTNFSKKNTGTTSTAHSKNTYTEISSVAYQNLYMRKWELIFVFFLGRTLLNRTLKRVLPLFGGACANQDQHYYIYIYISLIKCGCLRSWILDDTSLYRCCFRLLITYD